IHTLSVKEAALLEYFIQNKNKALSREQILKAIWEDKAEEASYRTIDNFIVLYRKLFENDAKKPQYFISIRGIGYIFKDN
ncbi:MAG: helix-turn-helix domain-containing protein, partial [Bacteroidia bacterium]|nr:helix-turn-helix domain-containing protein [Bacteroidia bacterium]